MKVPNKEELRTREQILEDFGCPVVPFDENVTMYYPAILSAMDEYRSQGEQEAMEKVIGELVEWMEEEANCNEANYKDPLINLQSRVACMNKYELLIRCIQMAQSLLKQEGE